MSTAPSQHENTLLECAGSPLRMRGIHRRGETLPVGSTTRGWMRPSSGRSASMRHPSARNRASGRNASSSRKNSTSPSTSGTPRLRPAGMPRFSGRCRVFTPAGSGGSAVAGSQPLPTHTTSTSTPCWSSTLRMPRARSSGRVPMVSTTTPTRGRRDVASGDSARGQERTRREAMIATKCPNTERIASGSSTSDHDAVDERLAEEEPDDGRGERDERELDRVVEPVERQEARRLAELRDEAAAGRGLAVGVGELRQARRSRGRRAPCR